MLLNLDAIWQAAADVILLASHSPLTPLSSINMSIQWVVVDCCTCPGATSVSSCKMQINKSTVFRLYSKDSNSSCLYLKGHDMLLASVYSTTFKSILNAGNQW